MIILPCSFPAGTNEAYRTTVMYVKGKPAARMYIEPAVAKWKHALTEGLRPLRPAWLDDPIPAYKGAKPYTVATAKGMHTVPLGLGVVWLLPKKLSWDRDLDGPYKFIQDCVSEAWGFNDSHIRSFVVTCSIGLTSILGTLTEPHIGINLTHVNLLSGPSSLQQEAEYRYFHPVSRRMHDATFSV